MGSLAAAPTHYLGLIGMPRRVYTYAPDLGWSFWNLVSTVGAAVIGVSFVVFAVNVVKTTRAGALAAADPWDGRTLEWSIPSPPGAWNFDRIPTVHGRDEFWLRKYGDDAGRRPTDPHPGPEAIHVPEPSYWPILLAASLLVMVAGLLVGIKPVVAGVLLTLYCMYRSALEHHRPPSLRP